MGQFLMYDENVMPEGCDPKLFALTFEMRSKRHEIEQYIESVKTKLELSRKTLDLSSAELEIIENDLKKTINELETYQVNILLMQYY